MPDLDEEKKTPTSKFFLTFKYFAIVISSLITKDRRVNSTGVYRMPATCRVQFSAPRILPKHTIPKLLPQGRGGDQHGSGGPTHDNRANSITLGRS